MYPNLIPILALATKEISNWRSSSGIGKDYASLAAFAGVSLLGAAIAVNMFAQNNGGMMKSLISPLGFGRTTKSTDVASKIPNLGNVFLRLCHKFILK